MTSVALALTLAASGPALDPQEVLRRSDPGRLSPQSFRARLRLARGDRAHDVEVWHQGRSRTLVRLLAPSDRGKFLLRRDDELWLVSPRTRRPTRLPKAYRLYGAASLDEALGRFQAENYVPTGVTEETDEQGGPLLVVDLEARDPKSTFPHARLLTRPGDFRALRIEYFLRSGKPATVVEFAGWDEGRPRRLVVRDHLHSEGSVTVDIVRLEELPVPLGLFDLEDGAARARLPPPLAAEGTPQQ